MDEFERPKNWNDKSFKGKLNLYRNKNLTLKFTYMDKLHIKSIIRSLKIKNLFFAKQIKRVKDHNYDKLVPIDFLFLPETQKAKLIHQPKNEFDIKIKSIKNDDYTKDYIIKSNFGWNSYIIVSNNHIKEIVYQNETFENNIEHFRKWKSLCLKSSSKKKKCKIFAEEFLGYNLPVYHFYCIHGKPIVFSFHKFKNNQQYENNYSIGLKINLTLLKTLLLSNSINLDIKFDENLIGKMILICKNISKNFQFVRIDLYHCRNRIYLSEFTFNPFGYKLNNIKWGKIGNLLNEQWN